MSDASKPGDKVIGRVKRAGAIILGVSENRAWIEVCYSGDLKRENILGPAEIVTEIQIPLPKTGSKGFYHKVRERQAWDHAIVSIATVVQGNGGAARDARVVLGGVAPVPWRAPKAEEFLRGKKIDEAAAQKAGEIALEGARPLKDNAYKIDLAKSLIRRALLASV
jgi:xanthine dehydrogenase YagS FAD-binding subunit